MNSLTQYLARAASQVKVDWLGLREVTETTTIHSVRDGFPSANQATTTSGIMVEVLVDGQFAYAASTNKSEQAVMDAAIRAEHIAKKLAPFRIHPFTSAARPIAKTQTRSLASRRYDPQQTKIVLDHLLDACKNLGGDSRISRRVASARFVNTLTRMVSSSGTSLEQEFDLISTNYAATASQPGSVQTRTDGGLLANSVQGGVEVFFAESVPERIRRTREQALELLVAPECPEETSSLILMPDQMMLQIHESIGHPLEIDRILGDERNYAGSSFVKLRDFGELRYGSPLLNVTFDPTIDGEFASYAYDDIGVRAEKQYLIRAGILERGLGSLESQLRAGVPGVANQRACSWNRPPIDRMANINVETGQQSLAQMIAGVERGILMESNRSWSIDDYRRKFQFGCEYGRRIENGELKHVVKNPNYRGVSVPFWSSLSALGNAQTNAVCGTPYCGKGEPNQIIRVGHASPVCRFDNVEVFGGA